MRAFTTTHHALVGYGGIITLDTAGSARATREREAATALTDSPIAFASSCTTFIRGNGA